MGRRNYLIEGVSGTGKTSVCTELQRRGYQAIHGDRELRYKGDPKTDDSHLSPLWDVEKVQTLAENSDEAVTFFCGSLRNLSQFIQLFDGVFILDVDLDTCLRRIDERVARDPTDWGGRPEERETIARLHQTKEAIPKDGIIIDATAPLMRVVDEILRHITL
jgi:thymidylate kinase